MIPVVVNYGESGVVVIASCMYFRKRNYCPSLTVIRHSDIVRVRVNK